MAASDVGHIQLGRQRSPKNRSSKFPTPYLRAANITDSGLNLDDVLDMEFSPDERRRYALQDGDLVLSEASGSPGQVGKPAIWRNELPLCCFQNTVIRMRARHARPKYLLWLFTHCYRNGVFAKVAGGVGINHLSAAKFSRLALPIAPDDEQERIVEEVEAQESRLIAGLSALMKVEASLKRYRAAVLKAACEGRLVPTEARLAHEASRSYETGEELIRKIRHNPNAKPNGAFAWAAPLSELKRIGPPEGWSWSSLGELGAVVGGLTKNPRRSKLKRSFPYLRVANVYANELRLEDIEQIGVEAWEFEKLRLQTADLLVVEGNGSKEQIGRVAIWDGSIDPCVHQNHIIKVRPAESRMSKWILYWLLSPSGRAFVEAVASSTSGLYTLSVNKVGALSIAVPPIAEQTRIVAEVERRLSVIDELEAIVKANLQRGARLRQSILDRAFSGRLVPTSR